MLSLFASCNAFQNARASADSGGNRYAKLSFDMKLFVNLSLYSFMKTVFSHDLATENNFSTV